LLQLERLREGLLNLSALLLSLIQGIDKSLILENIALGVGELIQELLLAFGKLDLELLFLLK